MTLDRRDFLKLSAGTGLFALGSGRMTASGLVQPAHAAPATNDAPIFDAQAPKPGEQPGLGLVLNGLAAILVPPQGPGDALTAGSIDVALLNAPSPHRSHIPALYLPAAGIDDTATTAKGEERCGLRRYLLKGSTLFIGDQTGVTYTYQPGAAGANLARTYDPVADLDLQGSSRGDIRSRDTSQALVTLTGGFLEHQPHVADIPEDAPTRAWGVAKGKSRVIKQIVRYRLLDAGRGITLRLKTDDGSESQIRLKDPAHTRIIGGLLNLPTVKMPPAAANTELFDATLYFGLFKVTNTPAHHSLVWTEAEGELEPWSPWCRAGESPEAKKQRDRRSIECSCCPPAVIPF